MWPGQNLDVTLKGLRPGGSVVARLQVEPVPRDPIRQLYLGPAPACGRAIRRLRRGEEHQRGDPPARN